MVRQMLRERRWAVSRYGYRMGPAGALALGATWMAQWLPVDVGQRLFRACVLGDGVVARRTPFGSGSLAAGIASSACSVPVQPISASAEAARLE
jgi:hypothetical protein